MNNKKLLLPIIVLASAIGIIESNPCGSTTDYAIEYRPVDRINRYGTAKSQVQNSLCSDLESYLTAPFTVSYRQRGINIDPDNNGNVGLLPEPFEIVFAYDCRGECDERSYPIGMQAFLLERFRFFRAIFRAFFSFCFCLTVSAMAASSANLSSLLFLALCDLFLFCRFLGA